METRFRIGIFTSTHGLKGEMKVYPTTDDIKRFSYLKKVFLNNDKEERLLEVEKVRYFKNMVILKFKGLDSINDIEGMKGASLFVSREDAAPLPEGSFYIADLIGLPVITDEGRRLGVLKEVLDTGANDVFLVQDPDDPKAREYLLPHIKSCVLKIDPEAGEILVHMMDGLEDL